MIGSVVFVSKSLSDLRHRMPFNTFEYLLFLPVVYLAFYFVGQRARWIVLLLASFLYYAALKEPHLLIVLGLVITITYGFGLYMGRVSCRRAKFFLLCGGIGINSFILIVTKYSSFLLGDVLIWPVNAVVTIGVSYYVFQVISYLIDIYLDVISPEPHFGYFALSVAFFPKLFQGPIERTGGLLSQLKSQFVFDYNNLQLGFLWFIWGMFKKVVVAERLALYVDAVYDKVHDYSGLSLVLATYAYAIQIYMDFSGYTDMALGSALLFNINLTQNFNSPYLATSVADFWRRWHISFSRWILDYIFKPLQVQWRNGRNWGTGAALIVTFLVSGAWHGLGSGFVAWGFLHGVFLAFSVFYRPYQKQIHKTFGMEGTWVLRIWQIFATFNLVSLGWVFFRAGSLADAFYVLENMFRGEGCDRLRILFSQEQGELVILFVVLGMYFVASTVIKHFGFSSFLKLTEYKKCLVVYLSITVILLLAKFQHTAFIYFKF